MNVRDRSVRLGVAGVGAVAALAVGMSPAAAVQATGLPGTFCSNDSGPFTGVGSTLQTTAINNIFNPDFTAACAKGTTLTWGGGGSGKGIVSQLDRTSLIGGTDDPLSPVVQAEIVAGVGSSAAGLGTGGPKPTQASPINTVPVAVAPVSVITNLPCFSGTLKLSSPNLANIYAGSIKNWNDAALLVNNPGLTTCAGHTIKRTARADVSGTTFLFKDYLSKRNAQYNVYKQDAENTAWPAAITCRGNGTGGEISCVQTTTDSIGYAATAKASTALGVVTEQVDDGGLTGTHVFSGPTPAGCTTAAGTLNAAQIPTNTLGNWSATSFTDPSTGYGICGLTYDLIFQNTNTAFAGAYTEGQVRNAVDWLTTALGTTAQSQLAASGYGALPDNILTVAQHGVAQVSYN